MKKLFFVFFFAIVAVSLPTRSMAQRATTISQEDKKEIIALFKNADARLYRLEFNRGREVHGLRKVSMNEIEQVRKLKSPHGDAASVLIVSKDSGAMFVFASTKNNVASLLGQEKADQLNSILAKYK